MAQAPKVLDFSPAGYRETQPVAVEADPEAGPRKLVRPSRPSSAPLAQPVPRRMRGAVPIAAHEPRMPLRRNDRTLASHAEASYFQKQIQTQTPMVFVLEDGEQIHGVIEWFDRDSIKVRNHTRTLLFKRGIKYLYKAIGDSA